MSCKVTVKIKNNIKTKTKKDKPGKSNNKPMRLARFKKKGCPSMRIKILNSKKGVLLNNTKFLLSGPKTNNKKIPLSKKVNLTADGKILLFTFNSIDNKYKTQLGQALQKNGTLVCDKACWKPGAPNSCGVIKKNYGVFVVCKRCNKKICGKMNGNLISTVPPWLNNACGANYAAAQDASCESCSPVPGAPDPTLNLNIFNGPVPAPPPTRTRCLNDSDCPNGQECFKTKLTCPLIQACPGR